MLITFHRKEDFLKPGEVVWAEVGAQEEFKGPFEIDKKCYR